MYYESSYFQNEYDIGDDVCMYVCMNVYKYTSCYVRISCAFNIFSTHFTVHFTKKI